MRKLCECGEPVAEPLFAFGHCMKCWHKMFGETVERSGKLVSMPPAQILPLSVGINKLSLQPGDVLVCTVPNIVEQGWLENVWNMMGSYCPAGVRRMIVCDNVKLLVLRAGETVVPEVDEAVTVEVTR